MKKLVVIFGLILCSPIPSFAWGPEGHRVVADIALRHLHSTTKARIRELIGNDDLAAISTWADEIRNDRPETYGWHFVDIPWNAEGFSEARDCYRPEDVHAPQDHHNCVVDRIEIFEHVLGDKKASPDQRREALKFLVHFIGDVHQPLHAIAEARGGNDIHILEFGSPQCGTRPCNLHYVWDFALIDHTRRSEVAYASFLEDLIKQQRLDSQAGGTPEEWANQSFHLARRVWLTQGGKVDESYFEKNIGVLDGQLAVAGLRLARVLNEALK